MKFKCGGSRPESAPAVYSRPATHHSPPGNRWMLINFLMDGSHCGLIWWRMDGVVGGGRQWGGRMGGGEREKRWMTRLWKSNNHIRKDGCNKSTVVTFPPHSPAKPTTAATATTETAATTVTTATMTNGDGKLKCQLSALMGSIGMDPFHQSSPLLIKSSRDSSLKSGNFNNSSSVELISIGGLNRPVIDSNPDTNGGFQSVR